MIISVFVRVCLPRKPVRSLKEVQEIYTTLVYSMFSVI